jgi:hypothetical protein
MGANQPYKATARRMTGPSDVASLKRQCLQPEQPDLQQAESEQQPAAALAGAAISGRATSTARRSLFMM